MFPLLDLGYVLRVSKLITTAPIKVEREAVAGYKEAVDRYREMLRIGEDTSWEACRDIPGLKTELMSFQEVAVALLTRAKKFLLAYDVGLGKTVITIAFALYLKNLGGQCKTLVVCKGSHKHRPWAELIGRFSDEKFIIIEGTKKERRELYKKAKSSPKIMFVVVNYESIVADAQFKTLEKGKRLDNIGPVGDIDFDLLAMDEVIKVKSTTTKTSKCMKKLASSIEYVVGLTGTPIKNSVTDLYGIFNVINPCVFSNYWSFINNYCVKNFWGQIVGYKNLEKLSKRIRCFSHQRLKTDVLKDLPAVTINNYTVELTKQQKKTMAKLTAMDLDPIGAIIYMRQICNSSLLVMGNPEKFKMDDHSGKVNMLKDLLSDVLAQRGRKVVVFSFFKKMVSLLKDEFEEYKPLVITGDVPTTCANSEQEDCSLCKKFERGCKSRKKVVWQFWNEDKKRIIIGTDAMSEGYDLQCADVVVNYDLPWTSAEFKQRIGRVYRIGQKSNKINVINLVCLGTVEEHIVDKINSKERLSNEVIGDYSFNKIAIDQLKAGEAIQTEEAVAAT